MKKLMRKNEQSNVKHAFSIEKDAKKPTVDCVN
jgi:hypothetical protein